MNLTGWQIDGPWPGQLYIVARPRGGDWLHDEIAGWSAAGIGVIVSSLEPSEASELELNDEPILCRNQNMNWKPCPIPDRGVPANRDRFSEFIEDVSTKLMAGQSIGVHCRQGIGRSGMIVIAILIAVGVPVATAIERVSAARGRAVPETDEQRQWIFRWASTFTALMTQPVH